MKCANCTKEAIWAFEDRGARNTYFCDAHLPWFLKDRAKRGLLKKLVIEATAPVVQPEPVVAPVVEEGYKADARDGDNDGYVQDGTDFERPVGETVPAPRKKKKKSVETPVEEPVAETVEEVVEVADENPTNTDEAGA